MTVNEMRHLYEYTEWANDLVLKSAEALSMEQLQHDVQISHKSILGTLAHMAGAEWIWLERWHGNSIVGMDAWSQWQADKFDGISHLRRTWQPVIEKRRAYLDRLKDEELPRQFEFKRLNGDQYSLPLVQQM